MTKIAFDIGGTFLKSAIIDGTFKLRGYEKQPTPENSQSPIVDEVLRRVKRYVETYDLKKVSIGISTAGAVNRKEGKIVYANDNILNYSGTNFKRALKPYTTNVHVYNDVDAAMLGELISRKEPIWSAFCLTLGTGIGGSYFHKDIGLSQGARWRANQIGNLLYDPISKTNYEQRASTQALKSLMRKSGHGHENVVQLFEEAKQNTKARQLLETWGYEVARGIAEIQIMYDPKVIIIGGGISQQGQALLDYICPYVQVFLPPHYGGAKIETARLQNHAALVGAVSKL
ncbi:ROK family protein [Staphylococcus ratti]|uniref:ROK family protein n=1 Tax=Staphylococcus ratti TaxID=2892440 RepID=A0ABY3PE01_9STAP|nr:ROK family protein [Staphylococcus ratti]UEX90548.1 ROK family protein [Staphylococcus ratti]